MTFRGLPHDFCNLTGRRLMPESIVLVCGWSVAKYVLIACLEIEQNGNDTPM